MVTIWVFFSRVLFIRSNVDAMVRDRAITSLSSPVSNASRSSGLNEPRLVVITVTVTAIISAFRFHKIRKPKQNKRRRTDRNRRKLKMSYAARTVKSRLSLSRVGSRCIPPGLPDSVCGFDLGPDEISRNTQISFSRCNFCSRAEKKNVKKTAKEKTKANSGSKRTEQSEQMKSIFVSLPLPRPSPSNPRKSAQINLSISIGKPFLYIFRYVHGRATMYFQAVLCAQHKQKTAVHIRR